MVIDTEPVKFPPLGLIVGEATVPAAVTFNVRLVVFAIPRPVAVTMMGKLPVGVEAVVLTDKTVEQLGLHDGIEKDDVAPAGIPETAKATAWLLLPMTVLVIVFVTEPPAVTDMFPEFASVKLELAGAAAFENHTLASALGCRPCLNAFALISVLVERVKGRLYFRDDAVGVCPSVV
jgi:hypothetical protein